MAVATHNSRGFFTPDEEREPTTHHGSGESREDAMSSVLDPGVYVDRYRILDVVGSGGIGVIYAAFDEALGRNVALKLLRPSARSSRKLERRRARLVREAQALARLSHPNVVPIYEVGMFEDRVFLAMEYIEGSTMRRWLRRTQRSWQEILDKYIQAGRGLAAAHAADIVHRDFKPDNVLVGEDERVRVLDFGLATPVPDALATGRYATLSFDDAPTPRGGRPKSAPHHLSESVSSLITAHGKVMGTPAYMSPEQSRGEPIDARSDQYSFCVALWEALFGERPHGPPTATARIRLHRRLSERGMTGKDVPQAIQRALERGLSVHPEDRFENMDALIAALSPRPASWRRWLLVGALPLVAAGALVAGMLGTEEGQVCPREDQALAGVWDDQVRTQIHDRLTATERPYAAATWDTVARELDRWSARWLDARTDACEDTKVRQEQSPVLLDLRMACLDRQLNSLAAVTETLATHTISGSEADAQLEAALAAVLKLPDPERCERSALVGGRTLLHEDPQLDGELEQLRRELARARGLFDLARLDEALALTDEVAAEAAAAGLTASELRGRDAGRPVPTASEPLLAETKLLRGQILAAAGKLEPAEEELRRAVFLAQQHGHDTVSVEACAALVDLLQARGELDSADDWAELGRATLARLGGDPHLEANLRFASARLARVRGDFDVALDDLRRVLEIREQLYGPEHVEVAKVLGEQVLAKTALGLHAEAEADSERALNILTTEFGITHPEVGLAYTHAAALHRARGSDHTALSKLLDALAIFEIAYDEQHPRIVDTYRALAPVHAALGEHEQALAALGRARSLATELYGERHASLVELGVESGRALHALGRDDEALASFDEAEQLAAKILAPTDPAKAELALARGDLHADAGRLDQALAAYHRAHELLNAGQTGDDERRALALGLLASVEHRQGEVERGLTHQREALALCRGVVGDEDPTLAFHRTWIGLGLVALGDYDEARPQLSRALELLGRHGDPRLRGRARLGLAELTWARGEKARARELSRAALADFEQLGERGVIERDAAKLWLRRHGG
jgi:serine/threonine protein kinase/tetratricopeptide (TPR) repeat protein